MKKNPRVIVQDVNDDWVRVYVDGKLVVDNHSIGYSEMYYVLKALGIEVENQEVTEE